MILYWLTPLLSSVSNWMQRRPEDCFRPRGRANAVLDSFSISDLCWHLGIEHSVKSNNGIEDIPKMNKRIHAMVAFAAVLSFALACTTAPTNVNTNSSAADASSLRAELKPAFDAITANDIMEHTKVMSA